MSVPIHAQPIAEFNGGKWQILCVTADGTLRIDGRDGAVDMPYRTGDAILVNERDEIICGPVSLAGAVELAEKVLDCDMRARTNPLTLLIIATALSAYSSVETDPEPLPASDALLAPAAGSA